MHTHRTFRQNIFFFLSPEVRCRLSVKNKMTRGKVELTGETKRQNGENEKKTYPKKDKEKSNWDDKWKKVAWSWAFR